MSTSYVWNDAEHTTIRQYDGKKHTIFEASESNRYYRGYLLSGATAEEFTPIVPDPNPTAEEKLAASGLTVDELQGLLGL